MKPSLKNISAVVLVAAMLAGCSSSPQAQHDKHMARGKALVAKKDYSRAILEFRNAAKAMPNDAEAFYQIGVAYLGMNDLKTGYAALRRAVELNPKHREAQLKIAQLLALATDPALLRDAESKLRALLDGTEAEPEVLNTLAFTELKLGKTQDAIQNYEQVLAQNPG